MPSGRRLEHAQYVTSLKMYFWSRFTAVASRILKSLLQGLDNVTAEGTEAIDNLTKMIETLVENGAEEGWGKTTECKVKEVKRYFKTDFKAHESRRTLN